MTSTWESASSAIGRVASGLLPAAISLTVRRYIRASADGLLGERRSSRQTSMQPPSLERPPQGHLVGVLEVAADRQPRCQAGDPEAEHLEHPREVAGGGLALEVGVGRDDDLGDDAVAEPGEQLAHAQVVGADAVDRADRAAEHVVAAAELAGALDRDDVLGLLDDADRVHVAPRVEADAAPLGLGDVEADLAEPHAGLDLGQRVREALDVRRVGLQEVEGDPLGALRPDARQPAELVDEVLDRAFVHPSRLRPRDGGVPCRRARDRGRMPPRRVAGAQMPTAAPVESGGSSL